jgi:PAS domain S-box-containing protein
VSAFRLAPELAEPGPTNVPVLLVDDNAMKRLALKAVLLPLGYRIVEADSCIAALHCVMAEDFAVILLDVMMPITDGFETAALIRQRRQSEMTPIIFITAFDRTELEKMDRYAQGAVDFIFAPVNPAELRAKVSVFANLFTRAAFLAARAREVQASADRLLLLTEAAPIGIFQTDASHRYVYTNPRWTEITGIPAAEAIGREWGTIIGAETRVGSISDLTEPDVQLGELSHRIEIRIPGLPPRIVLVTSRGVPDPSGGNAGWVGTIADVTAEAGAEAAMAEARDAALSASAMQKSFAASASHELRTPTTSILGYTEEVLDGSDLTEQDRGFLEVVYRNAQRLSQLIDDLLIVGEADIGAAMMNLEPTELAPLVERVITNFAATAQRADLTLHAELDQESPLALVDPRRLEQALTNLIGNAVKFTPKGGEITVGLHHRLGEIDIAVTDTGVGIDPDDIANIFGRFYRTKAALDSAVKGSGLGLAIAKRMVEAQNGQMHVTSELGRGSTFTMTVPTTTPELQHA